MRKPACLLSALLLLSAGLLATAGGSIAMLALRRPDDAASFRPRTAIVAPGTFRHRLDGEFSRNGRPVDAPLIETIIPAPLEIMAYQVSQADYGRCVAAAACQSPEQPGERRDLPVTGVSHADATAYARWLSQKTGESWRLPDDREWAYAAGSRFVDDARGLDSDSANPAQRWLADYEREAERKSTRDPRPRPAGSFGVNEHGVHDLAGNVWEWTQTCLRRVVLDAKAKPIEETRSCGVYVVEGQHRAMMTFFMRNPKAGGCSVATPPDNLGFRLVRSAGWPERTLAAMRGRPKT